MGLLDQVIGGLMGGGASSPMQNVLMGLLAGNQQQPQQQPQQGGFGGLAGMAQQAMGGGMGGQGGGMAGLAGLVSAFQQAGLGHVAESWISNGPNQAVSPQQLQSVFGEQQVNNMASQSGMAPQDFLSQLSQHLPNAVNGVTPNGRLPDEGTVSV